jgi:hypothetical protein
LTNTVLQPLYTWLTARAVGVSLATSLRSVSGVVQASLLMAGGVLVTRVFLLAEGASAAPTLLACVGVGLALIVPCVAWRAPEVVAELRALLRRTHRGEPLAGAAVAP